MTRDANDSIVPGCTGAFDPDEHGICRCCSMPDEWLCRCDEDTRDPNVASPEAREP